MRIYLEEKDIDKGNLILVNADHAYREGQAETALHSCTQDAAGPVLLKECAAFSLFRLLREIGGMGQIVPVSGWRSIKEQQQIWTDSLKENGQAFTETYVAVPGHSEHQTGLAIDLGKKQDVIDFIRPDFPYDGICQRFREKAAEYGFIERYPKNKEDITGIGHEPWHFRFVGTPHAAVMKEHGFTLEEYHSFLHRFSYGQEPYHYIGHRQEADIIYLRSADLESGHVELDLDAGKQYSVSGNNVDGFVMTIWKCA